MSTSKTKFAKIILILLALLTALPAGALALGISPGERYVENQSAQTFDFSGLILNSERKNMLVELEVGGDLKAYISVEPKEINFTKEDARVKYTYTVLVPLDLKGDKATGYILAKEKPSAELEGQAGIGGVVAVKSRITIGEPSDSDSPTVVVEMPGEMTRVDTPAPTSANADSNIKTTGLVVGKEGASGLFSNTLVGVILLIAGILILSGLIVLGIFYAKQRKKGVPARKSKRIKLLESLNFTSNKLYKLKK